MKDILLKLGFSDSKARTYLALVKLGKATPLTIAKEANVPTSKVYEILSWLYENGYCSIISQKPLTYKANDPKAILSSTVERDLDMLAQLKRDINAITTPYAGVERATFEIVHGRDAFYKKVKESVGRTQKSIIAVVKHWKLDYELSQLNSAACERGAKMRMIGPINRENKETIAEWKKCGFMVRHFLPDDTRYTVWDGRIITIAFKNQRDYFSLWIENEYLGKILTNHFDTLWKTSKPF